MTLRLAAADGVDGLVTTKEEGVSDDDGAGMELGVVERWDGGEFFKAGLGGDDVGAAAA